MLYIVNVDDCTFYMYGTNVSQNGLKVLHKQGLVAKSHEPAYNETHGRVSIYNFQKGEKLLSHKALSEVSLGGVVYGTAIGFVSAFNTLMAECCCASGGGGDYTEIIEHLETIERLITESNCCDQCNDWSIGTVDTETKTFPAGTIHSITIIVQSGTVNVSNGTENADLIEGQSITYNASNGNLTQAVTIDAALGVAKYTIIYCGTTTTTTGEPEATTTTEDCLLETVGVLTTEYEILEFPSISELN